MAHPLMSSPGSITHQIVEAVNKGFHPYSNSCSQELARNEYDDIIARTATPILIPVLSSLIRPGRLGDPMRNVIMRTLTELPLRPDGVRASLEFLFAAHPDNKRTQPQKGGASITPKAVSLATKLLCRVPSQLTPSSWFDGISAQILQLLDGMAGHDLSRTAAQIIDLGILRAGRYGTPGAPGWNALILPLLECVNPSLRSEAVRDDAAVVELRLGQVIVPAQSLETALSRLETLIVPNTNLGACYRVLHRIILQLWAIYSWRDASLGGIEPRPARAARALVQKYLSLFGELENVLPIIENLLYRGHVSPGDHTWIIHQNADGELEIVHYAQEASKMNREYDLSQIPHKTTIFVDIITVAYADEQLAKLFLHLLQRWVERRRKEADVQVRMILTQQEVQSPLLGELIETTLLMNLAERAPERLVTRHENKIVPICQLLLVDTPSAHGEEASAIALSLLNLVITSESFKKPDLGQQDLRLIERALKKISDEDRPEVSPMARNLALLLRNHGESGVGGHDTFNASHREVEDRKTYNLAMTYISGDGDNPPPVVAEGLSLLSSLILAQSPILDVMAVTVLMSSLLKDDEDFVNAKVVKVFTQLADKYPKSTVQELLDNYLDVQEKSSIDTRLRFGEAMIQVIERLGEMFSGDVVKQTYETLLSIAGRRGYRPKTAVKQAKEEKLRKMKEEKGMDMTEEEEEEEEEEDEMSHSEAMSQRERDDREVVAQIIQGWNRNQGSEDVRMRTSSLSILGAALESNIGGIERTVISNVVDLSVHVLTIETSPEYGILRRAAVMAIMSYVKAIDEARQSRQGLGLALTEARRLDLQRILAYVAETDNDGLVQQHARDVQERLEAGCSRELLMPGHEPPTDGLVGWMTGLRVNQRRPRIEEVE